MADLLLLNTLYGIAEVSKGYMSKPGGEERFLASISAMPSIYRLFKDDIIARKERSNEITARIERAFCHIDKMKDHAMQQMVKMPVEVSGWMIVKNEASTVERAILSLYNAVDELVVVDTGSTDGTQEIVKKYPRCRLIEKEIVPWDFSVARNFALKQCLGNYAIYIDGDEVCATPPDTVRQCLVNGQGIQTVCNIITVKGDRGYSYNAYTTEPRCFPLDGNIHFIHPVHNQIAVGKREYITTGSPIMYWHMPTADPEKDVRRKERTQKILDRIMDDMETGRKTFRNLYMAVKLSMHLGHLEMAAEIADAAVNDFDELSDRDKMLNSEYLLASAHVNIMLYEKADEKDRSPYLGRVAQFAAMHHGLFGDCADNCFYSHLLFAETRPKTALSFAEKYLACVEQEVSRPLWLCQTFRYYDEMVLRRDILKAVMT